MMSLSLDQLPYGVVAAIEEIDWNSLSESEGKRLRNFGIDHGVEVETLHRGPVGGDPVAVRIGRMTVAIRRNHARAVTVEPRRR